MWNENTPPGRAGCGSAPAPAHTAKTFRRRTSPTAPRHPAPVKPSSTPGGAGAAVTSAGAEAMANSPTIGSLLPGSWMVREVIRSVPVV